MLFLAAGLELLVAGCLWTQRFDRHRPWLTLWLASLFVTYRIGLLAIGYHGHCSCLGTMFDWVPALEKWANPMMWFALVGMSVISVVSIWQDRARNRQLEQTLATFV